MITGRYHYYNNTGTGNNSLLITKTLLDEKAGRYLKKAWQMDDDSIANEIVTVGPDHTTRQQMEVIRLITEVKKLHVVFAQNSLNLEIKKSQNV
jgi:hypothetical protein